MAYVLTHPEHGIYIGSCMGLGFWSKLDAAGQDAVCTFVSEAEAAEYIQSWDGGHNPADYQLKPVTPSLDNYATVADLRAAGLEALLGEMANTTPAQPAPERGSQEPEGPSL